MLCRCHGGLTLPIGIVLLDVLIYFQHVMFHAVPALWRLHRVHHADLDFDVTTGVRFHPIEILLSTVHQMRRRSRSSALPHWPCWYSRCC